MKEQQQIDQRGLDNLDNVEMKSKKIEDFWNWFASIAPRLAMDFENRDLLNELDCQIRDLDPRLSWELGPGTSAHSARLSLLYNGFLSCGRRCVFFGPDPALFGRDRAPPATIPLHFPPRPSSSGRCGILVFLLSRFSRGLLHRCAYTRIFAVKPEPPVEETNRIRTNRACTFATVRASPVVAVVVSRV